MKKMLFAVIALAISTTAFAERKMTREEIIETFTDVTFDGVFLPKNKHFVAYDAPDGELVILRPNGNRDKNRTWFVNDEGQRCATNPRWSEARCFDLFDAGNGKYHQYLNGKHLHILSNLRKGNHL